MYGKRTNKVKRWMVHDRSICEAALDLDIDFLQATSAMRLSYRLRDDTLIYAR